jgi:hypothetical protein
MGPGTRTPSSLGRPHRLSTVAVVAACCLAVPAGASAQQSQGLSVSGLTGAATGAVGAAGSAVESTVKAAAPVTGPAQGTVTQLAGTVGQVTGPEGPVARVGASAAEATGSVAQRATRTAAPVAGVADPVVPDARPAVETAVRRATGATGGALRSVGAGAGQGSPRVERLMGPAVGGETARGSQLRLQETAAAQRPDRVHQTPLAERFSSVFTPLIPGPPLDLPSTPAGGSDSGSSGAASAPPSAPEPLPGPAGGSSAGGASISFSLGGLALLLATLSLAGPALRRRLPGRPVIGWPAAFVPLLERPG